MSRLWCTALHCRLGVRARLRQRDGRGARCWSPRALGRGQRSGNLGSDTQPSPPPGGLVRLRPRVLPGWQLPIAAHCRAVEFRRVEAESQHRNNSSEPAGGCNTRRGLVLSAGLLAPSGTARARFPAGRIGGVDSSLVCLRGSGRRIGALPDLRQTDAARDRFRHRPGTGAPASRCAAGQLKARSRHSPRTCRRTAADGVERQAWTS